MKKIFIFIFILVCTRAFAPNLPKELDTMRHSLILAELREQALEERRLEIKEMAFSRDLLEEYMVISEPTITIVSLKQFVLETGWFKSESFKTYNNIAGMRLAKVRETTATGSAMRHAKYDHWTDSVDDYILWMKYWKSKGYNTGDFYRFLDEIGYATAKNYERVLRSINLETVYL